MQVRRMWIGLSTATALLVGCGTQQPVAQTTAAPAPTQSAATSAPATTIGATAATGSTPAAAATTGATAAGATSLVATTSAADTSTMAGTTQNATPKIVAAANAFLATLSSTEKSTVLFDWSNTAQKQKWSNFPPAGFTRAGLMWGNMSAAQQNAWLALMQATLSTEGYNRVNAEWSADDALAAQQGTSAGFGKNNYYIAIIGTPSETSGWQWQFGGHHVTVNATIVGSNIALTPSFIGCQVCTYTANGTTVRPLGDIEDDAFTLVTSLDATQQKAAVLGSTPIDLVLGPGQGGKTLQAEGLPASQMTATQQAAFLKLIGHYTGLGYNAAARTAEIQSTLALTYFAWYGPTTKGSVAYFRVTGPTIVIEYSPQSEPRSNAPPTNLHVHGIYRDPTNDYGAKYTGITIGY